MDKNVPKNEIQPQKESDPKPVNPYPFPFVSRAEWGAMEASEKLPLIDHPIDYFAYKFSNTDPCISQTACLKNIKELQRYHMLVKGLPDIAFNFIIGGDLRVYEGRGWFYKPTQLDDKLLEYEGKYLSIGYMGLIGAGIDRNFYCVEILDLRDDLVQYGIDKDYLDENARFDRIDIWTMD